MRTMLLAGSFLATLLIPAAAQSPSEEQGGQGLQGNPGYENDQDDYGPPRQMWRGAGPQGRYGWGRWRDEGGPSGYMGHRFNPEYMPDTMRMMSAGAGGTFYRFKRGNDEIAIHCSPREQLKDCVDGATELMKALPQTGSTAQTGQPQQH